MSVEPNDADGPLRAAMEAGFDPAMALDCVRVGGGVISDFTVRELNGRAAKRWDHPVARQRLSTILERPLFEALLSRCARAVETGTVLDEPIGGFEWRIAPFPGGVMLTWRDVGADEAERNMRASLKEKERLLKEIHHRVKNNLQVIASLLNLQAPHIRDPQAFEMFQESQNRVRSIALFHEKLYQSSDPARIDVTDYLRNLAMSLMSSFGPRAGGIDVQVSGDPVLLGVDNAVPCGLIANELITNALKHAFPAEKRGGRGRGRVEVEFKKVRREDGGERLTLRVADDGVGLAEDISLPEARSLGFQIVTMLTEQLGGEVEVRRGGGVEIQVSFAVS